MSKHADQIIVDEITRTINGLGQAEQEACWELVDFFKMNMSRAGEPVGTLAIALVRAEIQLQDTP